MSAAGLPWRGPGPGRPDLPLPPASMPLRRGGAWRKRWRYAAFFSAELAACAAAVEVGPARQVFWALWEPASGLFLERTRMALPGRPAEVWSEGFGGERVERAPDGGSTLRVEGRGTEAGDVSAALRFGAGEWVEAVCAAEGDGYVWTRKRCDVPVEGEVWIGARRIGVAARGGEDESAGYHPRHTLWSWSAGVGKATDGRSVGWNLVAGVNDPPERSERAIWIDGEPAAEPAPVAFEGEDGLGGVRFADGTSLAFSAGAERSRSENRLVVRYSYRQPFGAFSGALPGGLELASGLGVIERHEAWW